jgi:hypothetical protein
MKTIYLTALIACCLLRLSTQAQITETITQSGDIPTNSLAYLPEGAVAVVTSNGVDAVSIFLLPDLTDQVSQAGPLSIQGAVVDTDTTVATAIPIQEASSNGQSVIRFVLQSYPATLTPTTGPALTTTPGGFSPQPLTLIGGCVRPGSGLLGWWRAEGNANDSAGANPGQLVGGVTYGSGEVAQTFSFNGQNASVQIPYASALATPSVTIEAWIYPSNQITSQAFIFGQAYARQLVVQPGTGGINVAFYVTDSNNTFYGITTPRVIPAAQWTHLAGTYDGTTLKLYTNGVLCRSAALALPALGDLHCPFSIGGMNNSCGASGQYFKGCVDEASIYDRALFAGEINAIYLAGSAGKCTTPPVCVASPVGALAWWPGEFDGSDVIGNNLGTLLNGATCVPGLRGQAFSFSSTSQAVEVPLSFPPNAPGFSVETWVKPASRGSGQSILFAQSFGRQLVVRPGNCGLVVAWLVNTDPSHFYETDSSAEIPLNEWTHLVGTWDSTALRLYINGALDQQATPGIVPWDSGCNSEIGGIYHPSGSCIATGQYFNGLIDETTYYSQALSATDVQSLYNAGSAGKCWPDPAILEQPQPVAQSASPGGTATFTVVATGTAPLSYQWYRSSSAIPGASNSALTLNNLSLFDAGSYNVVVSSIGGSASSAAATLTVSQVAAPSLSPVGGSYPSTRNVVVTCPTSGAIIYYTLNGQEPTTSDPIVTSGFSVTVDHSLTLKAKAFKTGWTTSATENEGYRIEATPSDQPPVVTVSPPTGTTLLASDDLPILVEASDPDGTVTGIQLLCNGVPVAQTTASPLQYTMDQVSSGTYTFTARATDDAGFVTVSPATVITVNASGPVVSLAGQQPYFTSTPGTLVASVLGVNPGSLAHLTLNGVAVEALTGTMNLTPALSQGANTFTLVATDKQNRVGQATTTVYLDSVPPVISISAPANNSTFATTRINVLGSFTEANLKSITVNGVPAFVTGSATWEALNVPLAVGANTITATAEDLAGNSSAVTIAVTGNANPVDPVQLTATPVGGFAPLQVTLQVQSSAPGTLQQVLYDFTGDDTSFQTAANLQPIIHTYSSPGQYFPAVTLVTTAGRFSSAGGWNSGDPSRLQINVQASLQQVGDAIAVADPVDLKATADGKLYVLSRSTATIREYDTTTTPPTLIRSKSSIGTTPTGLDVDSAANVYVAISGDNQVAKFNPTTGSFQLDPTFGIAGIIGKPDKSSGNGNGQFNGPYDVAITPDGEQIAVSDSGNNRFQSFAKSGAFIDSFGQAGSDPGEFSAPRGLTYDEDGLLFIVDSANNRTAVGESPDAVETSGSPGITLGQFQGPVNISVGTRGIYVADTGNNRIEVFAPADSGCMSPGLTPFSPRLALSTELGLNQPRSVAAVEDALEEKVYIADTGNNRVILVRLPSTGSPADAWNSMTARLIAGDIGGALQYFSSGEVDRFQRAFMWIGTTDLAGVIGDIGPISPIFIHGDSARYYFQQVISGVTLGFPIEFAKENGKWVIVDF